MRPYNVCGLGNAIVDIFIEVNDQEFADLGFDRGTMRLVEPQEQKELIEKLVTDRSDLKLVSGGSVANSIIGLSQLGGTGAFIGCVGDDRYGVHYDEEFKELKINFDNSIIPAAQTGTCLALITPDAERTMRTSLAVSSELAAKHVDPKRIQDSEWLFIEGYVFANPATGQLAIREAIRIAKEAGTKVAITCSDAFVPQVFGDALLEAMQSCDLFFCNAPEAMAVTKTDDSAAAFEALKKLVPNCVVTDGPNGAFVNFDGQVAHVASFPCHPRDLTGAGDMFAGAFLYGITHGYSPAVAARGANYMCMNVISQVGARLTADAGTLWREAVDDYRADDVGG